MDFFQPPIASDPLFERINAAYRADEADHVRLLLKQLNWPASLRGRIQTRARALVEEVRRRHAHASGVDAFMHEYALSSQEGVVLMCLAEALLRIPDEATVDALIRDKIAPADWERHLGRSESLFVNASAWGLMLTGRFMHLRDEAGLFRRLLERMGEPVIRQALKQAMRIMARQFVMGRTIDEALSRARSAQPNYRHSYDMLGEAARTKADAQRYFEAYALAIEAIGRQAAGRGPIDGPGISVKLSALHPRYEINQAERVMTELVARLAELARLAKAHDIGLTIDAEEADRLDLQLSVLAELARDPGLAGWEGLGLALQAYQKRAFYVLDYLAELAAGRRLMVRLVKGAYWDTEIKRAQERGLDGYPVFTRKANTDVSYLACAGRLLRHRARLHPQFATHNAHTVAAVLELAGEPTSFEFQRLHGMGEDLYDPLVGEDGVACRVYAPVGSHEDLLPYLVRRLLENGANTSFVNRIVDDKLPVNEIIADPVERVGRLSSIPHPRIPPPSALFLPERANSRGVDLSDVAALTALSRAMSEAAAAEWRAAPLVAGKAREGITRAVTDPADRRRAVGTVEEADAALAVAALEAAARAAPRWDATGVETRAAVLERAADLLEARMPAFMALCTREAGKSVGDGVAEVREAVDFCRYYAARAREDFRPRPLPGPTGERNSLSLHGRGVFVCISPWNFPLAIFMGQVAAALVAGNAVIAKPAEQTPLIAHAAVQLLYEAGLPPEVLQFLPGPGPELGAALLDDPRVAGVAFTGSTDTAWAINRRLAARQAPIASLIAETGGQNAMIVDSSALLEQVVNDVLFSGFQSAGQRCSALRVLCVQEEVAERLLEMLAGAMVELRIGDPWRLSTDVGPVIDEEARARLLEHARRMEAEARLIHRCPLPAECEHGSFFAPHAFEIDRLDQLKGEVFGPVVHVLRYRARELEALVDAINATGFGLTFGVHSRIDATVRRIVERVRAGNVYVNRHMIGAVVGVQPFGGQGLSGTGPKAGGPHYLYRFASERAVSVNTAAAGGNAALLSMEEEPDR